MHAVLRWVVHMAVCPLPCLLKMLAAHGVPVVWQQCRGQAYTLERGKFKKGRGASCYWSRRRRLDMLMRGRGAHGRPHGGRAPTVGPQIMKG